MFFQFKIFIKNVFPLPKKFFLNRMELKLHNPKKKPHCKIFFSLKALLYPPFKSLKQLTLINKCEK